MAARLIQFRLCARSRSIRLALAELNQDIALVDENPWEWRQGFLAKNPSGELPVLEFDDGLTLAGVYAISEFIAEDAPPPEAGRRPFNLFPGTREDRAEVRRLVDWFHGKLERETTKELLFEKVYRRMTPSIAQAPDSDVLRAARVNFKYHLSYLSYLSEARRWLAGDDLSFADFAAAAHLSTLDYLGEVTWDEAPSVKSWYQRVKSRPAFRAVLADRVPGTPPPLAYADLDF
ncbi:MAG: glutathione S-transferase family protein [Hyphomicrobium sp.]